MAWVDVVTIFFPVAFPVGALNRVDDDCWEVFFEQMHVGFLRVTIFFQIESWEFFYYS